MEADPRLPGHRGAANADGESDRGGRLAENVPRGPVRSDRIEEYLATFHRLAGLRFRMQLVHADETITMHDSLGEATGLDVVESSWPVMPGLRLRLILGPSTAPAEREVVAALLKESVSRLVASEREARFFAGELAERYEEIDLLTSAGETLGSVIHLERAAGRLLERLASVLGSDRAAVWVPGRDGTRLERLASGGPASGDGDGDPSDEFRERMDQVLRGRGPQVWDLGTPPDGPKRAYLAVPLRHSALPGSGAAAGVLTVRGREGRPTFTQAEVNVASTVGSHLAAAIENGRLVQDTLVQERMLVELELAHHLQMKLLPDLEDFREIADVAARCEPAESVGGDFYHLFRLPGDRLGVMLGDVSSHGYSAGLIMALTMSAASLTAREEEEPAHVLRGIHHELVRKLESTEMYMTVCYVVLDPRAGRLQYANAGHPHAFRINAAGAHRLEALNPPLGIAEFDSYAQREMEWQPGRDLLLMFTDGVSECLESDRLWSDELLTRLAMDRAAEGAQEVLDGVFELASPPAGVAADDRTALVVR